MEFRAHRLIFRCRVQGSLLLNEHKGAALRGVFSEAVRHYCQRPDLGSCHPCVLLSCCPVSHLVSPVEESGRRGPDIPRPYAVEPPLEPQDRYEDGSAFVFGLTLYGQGIQGLRIVLGGLRARASLPLGRKAQQGNGFLGRGALRLEEVVIRDPGTDQEAVVMRTTDHLARMPDLAVTHEGVLRRAAAMGELERVTVHFLTPTRLVDAGRLVHRPEMRPLVQRLVERLSSLWEHYAGASPPLDFAGLMDAAARVRTAEDSTRWVDLESYSARRDLRTPIGGFVGRTTFEGPIAHLLPWLIWGEYTHVGKNAVKGDGWYRLEG